MLLEYKFTNDILFKMMFTQRQDLLKKLVSQLLAIDADSIEEFSIENPEIPPDVIGDKFCRLDINMTIDGQWVDLEIQVRDEGDYPERTLYYWAREYSLALQEGQPYSTLPRAVIISIVAFNMFDCEEYHSQFQALEVSRHTRLTDRLSLHYFELPKLPDAVNASKALELWLKLFDAETEEDLRKIEVLEVSEMSEAITTYRSVTAKPEFRALERMISDARHNEASALANAERKGREQEKVIWQGIVAEKDREIARLRAQKG